MKKLLFTTALGLSLSSFSAFAAEMTGYVSESHCGAKHDKVSEANTKCIEGCLKGGSEPVIVSDGKVYKLDADSQQKAVKLAGKEVKINGTADGDTLKIDTIEAAGE